MKDLLGELYGYNNNILSFLDWLPDPDPILSETGDGVSVLRSLTSDDKVISSIQNRKLGTLKKQQCFFSTECKDSRSIAICDQLKADISNINLYDVFSQILDAPCYGMIPAELIWFSENGKIRLKEIKVRPVEWFGFNGKYEPVFRSQNMFHAKQINRDKLVIARHFPNAKNPYGLRLLSRCLWPVALKKGGLKFWIKFTEKFGSPWVVGKISKKDETKRQNLLNSLYEMVTTAVAVVDGDDEINFHESSKSGDTHERLLNYCDKSIARAICGQNLTSDGVNTGTYAESKTSLASLSTYQEADEQLIVSFMNEVAKIYTRLNDSQATSPVFSYIEPEDLIYRADIDNKLYTTGVRFKEQYYIETYGLKKGSFTVSEG
jgi:phage gp29-like protein